MANSPPGLFLSDLSNQSYKAAFTVYGDFGLSRETYTRRLRDIFKKHLGPVPKEEVTVDFLKRLHTTDLYLATACAMPSEVAWEIFDSAYKEFIRRASFSVSPTETAGLELAESLLGHIFLPDSSGHSRIGSYDGRSSLATWLAAVVNNRALCERERRCNNLEPLDIGVPICDKGAVNRVLKALRADRYQAATADSLTVAVKSLEKRERLLVLLRYDESLTGLQIAALLKVHPSTISRQLRRAESKLRESVVETLRSRYSLTKGGMEEAIDDLLESPAYSVLSLLKRT